MTYTQETTAFEDGSYELTMPYPTEEGLGPEEDYTDSDYTVTAREATTTAEVPEEAVYAGETVEGGTPDEGGLADGE